MDLAIVRSINQAEVDVLIDTTSLDYGLVYTVFLSAPLQDDYGFHPNCKRVRAVSGQRLAGVHILS
jgi:hypothetical protein